MPPEAEKAASAGERKARLCPICGKPVQDTTRPFCSSRCRDVDLHRWLSGSYILRGSENDDQDAK